MPAVPVNVWRFNGATRPSYEDLDEIGAFLVQSFSGYLRQSVIVVKQHLVLNDGLVFSFRREQQADTLLNLYLEGHILYTAKYPAPSINVELFLFVNGRRIGCIGERVSSIYGFRAERAEDDGVCWLPTGWHRDEFDEWAYIAKPQWIDQRDVHRTLD